MFRFKTPHLFLLLGLIAPVYSYAANYCIAVDGGFPGGTSYIGTGFSVPAAGTCAPWSGFTKTASTVILFATGTGCVSSNGKVLTLAIFDADPGYTETPYSDYILLCAQGFDTCYLGVNGSDTGGLGNGDVAKQETCTPSLLNLPPSHA